MQPWPEERTKRSRFTHFGSSGLYCISSAKRRYPIGAWPIGAPGWPLLALFTASTAKKRMALMHSVSTSTSVAVAMQTTFSFFAHRLDGRTVAAAASAAAPAPTTLALAPTALVGAADATGAGALVTTFSFLARFSNNAKIKVAQIRRRNIQIGTLKQTCTQIQTISGRLAMIDSLPHAVQPRYCRCHESRHQHGGSSASSHCCGSTLGASGWHGKKDRGTGRLLCNGAKCCNTKRDELSGYNTHVNVNN